MQLVVGSGGALDVRPSAYAAAAATLGDDVAGVIERVLADLLAALADTGGMAGSDTAGVSWGGDYDVAAAAAVAATVDLGNGCTQLAVLLEQTGINYAGAEQASVFGEPAFDARNRWRFRWRDPPRAVPSSIGPGVDAPYGWSALQDRIGLLWPDGHQDLLRAASEAWSRAIGGLTSVVGAVIAAGVRITDQRTPESTAALTVIQGVCLHIEDLCATFLGLADACADYAEHVDAAHHAIIAELESFLKWTGCLEGGGILFTALSAGLSDVFAQVGVGVEVARVVKAIRTVIELFLTAVEAFAVEVRAVVASAVRVARSIEPLIQRRLVEVRLAAASDRGAVDFGAFFSRARAADKMAPIAKDTPETKALVSLESEAELPSRLDVTLRQVEAKFKHAADFGVLDPRGRAGFEQFAAVLRKFLDSGTVTRITGTYRGQPVILNIDRDTNLVVIQNSDGEFISGWKMSTEQATHVYERGDLGGS